MFTWVIIVWYKNVFWLVKVFFIETCKESLFIRGTISCKMVAGWAVPLGAREHTDQTNVCLTHKWFNLALVGFFFCFFHTELFTWRQIKTPSPMLLHPFFPLYHHPYHHYWFDVTFLELDYLSGILHFMPSSRAATMTDNLVWVVKGSLD